MAMGSGGSWRPEGWAVQAERMLSSGSRKRYKYIIVIPTANGGAVSEIVESGKGPAQMKNACDVCAATSVLIDEWTEEFCADGAMAK